MKKLIVKYSTTLILFFVSFLALHAETPKRNSILFFEIDDWVEVYVDGKKVYAKAALEGDLGEPVDFNLNPFIEGKVDPLVEIKLINAKCPTCESGNGWTVEFEVFQDGESVDYIIEEGDSIGGSVVFSIEYDWGYI